MSESAPAAPAPPLSPADEKPSSILAHTGDVIGSPPSLLILGRIVVAAVRVSNGGSFRSPSALRLVT